MTDAPTPSASVPDRAASASPPRRRHTFLGRLAAAVREQNWFAVALEVVIVVVGVFLGVQLGNWNAARIERERADAVIESLADDFVAIRRSSDNAVGFHENRIDDLQALALALDRGEMAEGDSARIRSALATGAAFATPPSSPATFTELLSSGQTRLVRNDSLRRALIRFHRQVEGAPAAFLHIRTEQAALDAFRRYGDYSDDVGDRGGGYREPAVTSFDFDAMRADPEFLQAVRRQRVLQWYYWLWQTDARDDIEAIQTLLDEAAP